MGFWCLLFVLIRQGLRRGPGPQRLIRERETFIASWAKAGKDSKGRNKAMRSEGDDLGDSAARALMRHGGRGRGVRG